MSTYRLFSASDTPAQIVSYTGNYIAGVGFAVKGGGNWLDGYWWYVGSGQSTTPVKCALWQVGAEQPPLYPGPVNNVLIPGSVVTSAPLSAGWNFIPLPEPIQLAPSYDPGTSVYGSIYVAAVGVNGPFPYTASSFNSGDVYAAGITNGPLVAYSGTTGSLPAPYQFPQGLLSTAGADPETTPPLNADTAGDFGSNFWVDVQVSDTPPAGYTGTYRLWPNKGDANNYTVVDAAVAYNVATEIDISSSVTLNYVHYWVPASTPTAVATLATAADVWDIATGQPVASLSSPAWTTESGGAVTLGTAGQWVKAAWPDGLTLKPGKYRVGVYDANGASGAVGWNGKDASTGYFTTGVAADGITWGPLTAPNLANAQTGTYYPGTGTGTTNAQPVFAYDGSDDFPDITTGNNPPQVYWVDLEVTPVPASGLLMSAGIA